MISNSSLDPLPVLTTRRDFPEKSQWIQTIQSALHYLKQTGYSKIVLARQTTFDCQSQLNPLTLLQHLAQATNARFLFCFQPQENLAFIGASPERLYYRKKREIQTEALAGTRPRGQTEEEERQWTKELLENPKERYDHEVVFQHIFQALLQIYDNY